MKYSKKRVYIDTERCSYSTYSYNLHWFGNGFASQNRMRSDIQKRYR